LEGLWFFAADTRLLGTWPPTRSAAPAALCVPQLYNLADDFRGFTDVARKYPVVARQMSAKTEGVHRVRRNTDARKLQLPPSLDTEGNPVLK
jgi:hypothetical protein